MPEPTAAALTAACAARGVDPAWIPGVVRYLELLERWNRVHNLTAVKGAQAMLDRHVVDSLTLLPWLHGDRVLDVGSGAGLPGLVLALADRKREYLLVDAAAKRVRFLRAAIAALALPHVTAVHARIEDLRPERGFATVVSRAFAAPPEFVRRAGHRVEPGGRMLAMLGQPGAAHTALPEGWSYRDIVPVSIPGSAASRHIAIIEREIA
ncbi:rRNA small subunit 7-methylguanosine (m7G) methyltransferase GidB [Thioalkalivibrio nitratireducens DSM 14787]|uniref:Ribosomal RNA small subunit methyltransferase G n=1 Tax=Thioalkalivibrio nitratireducens (strain DSM 14787 / UNIQEM 213 / ALEN2) TaxID=1255043 RepID=L0E0H6_THIND|nr:16S rRNA (guanine(527)-N(7))-methyltransferase RsmG [Thioalkalivibrio nitratireducens]AGA35334.1 rRNA small subunit 7-methylguanosine (m7G) methyltransferase GidB [Thioalkalivibrio nitratireducens DSM 14787]